MFLNTCVQWKRPTVLAVCSREGKKLRLMFIFFVSCFSRTCFYFSISFIECVCVLFWSILCTATTLRSRASYIHSKSNISTTRIVCARAFSRISLHKHLIVHLFIKIIFERQNSFFVFFFLFSLTLLLVVCVRYSFRASDRMCGRSLIAHLVILCRKWTRWRKNN